MANKNPDEAKAWSDGEIQSSGIPIAGAIVKSINTIVQVGKLAFKLKDYFQERKESKQRDPAHKAHTHDERWEMFMETVETIQSLLDSVLAWHGSFTTYLGQLPVIGAIIGAVNAGIGLVEDAIRLGKAEHYLRHIRAQKADAKLAVKNTQGALSGRNEYGSEQTKKYGFFHLKSKKRFKVNREFELPPAQEPTAAERYGWMKRPSSCAIRPARPLSAPPGCRAPRPRSGRRPSAPWRITTSSRRSPSQ